MGLQDVMEMLDNSMSVDRETCWSHLKLVIVYGLVPALRHFYEESYLFIHKLKVIFD